MQSCYFFNKDTTFMLKRYTANIWFDAITTQVVDAFMLIFHFICVYMSRVVPYTPTYLYLSFSRSLSLLLNKYIYIYKDVSLEWDRTQATLHQNTVALNLFSMKWTGTRVSSMRNILFWFSWQCVQISNKRDTLKKPGVFRGNFILAKYCQNSINHSPGTQARCRTAQGNANTQYSNTSSQINSTFPQFPLNWIPNVRSKLSIHSGRTPFPNGKRWVCI